MATPLTSVKLSLGNRDGVMARFATLVNNDTWATGLGTVEGVCITNGASGQTTGATYSGGVVTFKTSGPLTNVGVLAIGFK